MRRRASTCGALGIPQVWRAAFEKRCQALLVETGYEYPADLSPEGDQLISYTGKGELRRWTTPLTR